MRAKKFCFAIALTLFLGLLQFSCSLMESGPRPRLYFAHAVNLYGTPLETHIQILLRHRFQGEYDIENPNQPNHQKGYTEQGGMDYFFNEVLPQMDACVAMPFFDGMWGKGVAGEAKWFLERGKPVWVLDPPEILTKNPAVPVFFSLRKLRPEEIQKITTDDPTLVLSREETRLRTWLIYNKVFRSFTEAHKAKMPIPEGFYPQK
ncbi:hypothetical protein HYT01_03990 [Candidatus Giovannonibacteria bacterium]|nr:hypothetical protein [Candidatus Giovannonibacteria bacterium]